MSTRRRTRAARAACATGRQQRCAVGTENGRTETVGAVAKGRRKHAEGEELERETKRPGGRGDYLIRLGRFCAGNQWREPCVSYSLPPHRENWRIRTLSSRRLSAVAIGRKMLSRSLRVASGVRPFWRDSAWSGRRAHAPPPLILPQVHYLARPFSAQSLKVRAALAHPHLFRAHARRRRPACPPFPPPPDRAAKLLRPPRERRP